MLAGVIETAAATEVAGAGVLTIASNVDSYNQTVNCLKDSSMFESNVNWSNYNYKHFPPKNISWKDIINSTKNGPAKYKPEVNIEELEKLVWKKGTRTTNGKTWKVMEFDNIIGASEGVETRYVRVELSAGTIHGHPITELEYRNLLK